MKKSQFKFTSDAFKKARGGYSRLLEIVCTKCGKRVCLYQKDGPGLLKRMYLDRMFERDGSNGVSGSIKNLPQLICHGCKEHLGIPMLYKKEDRPAYRLFVGSVTKKIVNSKVAKL